jgi:quercetin dioxygenase-like cupin family protein
MSLSSISPGQIIDVKVREVQDVACRTMPLLKTEALEIVRLLIPAGEKVPTYQAQGEVILHCLEGAVQLLALGKPQVLNAGQLVYLVLQEPFSLQGIEDSSVLVTMLAAQRGPRVDVIGEM